MQYLHEQYGFTYFSFVHDMYTVDRKKVVEFCQGLIELGKPFTWGCIARTDCVRRRIACTDGGRGVSRDFLRDRNRLRTNAEGDPQETRPGRGLETDPVRGKADTG